MTRLVIRLELETRPNGHSETADMPIDLGLLAPSLSPAEIGEEVLKWASPAISGLMNQLREMEADKCQQ